MYLEGLLDDPAVPLSMQEPEPWAQGGGQAAEAAAGPVARTANAGADVIDIRGMIAGFENDPEARRQL